jgi:hypothetical protein
MIFINTNICAIMIFINTNISVTVKNRTFSVPHLGNYQTPLQASNTENSVKYDLYGLSKKRILHKAKKVVLYNNSMALVRT